MTHPRHLRQRYRHARRHHLPQRIGKLPIITAAALGAVTFGTLPVTQALSPASATHSDQAGVVGAAVVGEHGLRDAVAAAGAAVTPAPAGTSAPTGPGAPAGKAQPAKPAEAKTVPAKTAPEKKAPATVELYYQYRVQTTPWYCGPAAARMALSARGIYASQDDLARRLGTTLNGTNSSDDIARVLNAVTGTSHYQATSIPAKSVTKAQIEKLRADIVDSLSHTFPVVVNVAGTATDLGGTTRSFPGGHYITVVGYRYNGTQAKIGDSANPASPSYWISTAELAQWAGTRGYAA